MPEIVEREPEYEVKEVLDSKIVGRKVWYDVDWVGYGPEGRTWESVENLAYSKKLVTAYHRRHPNCKVPVLGR
jgi:Chromo (CHRromatin Organisation MOdifier) domain